MLFSLGWLSSAVFSWLLICLSSASVVAWFNLLENVATAHVVLIILSVLVDYAPQAIMVDISFNTVFDMIVMGMRARFSM